MRGRRLGRGQGDGLERTHHPGTPDVDLNRALAAGSNRPRRDVGRVADLDGHHGIDDGGRDGYHGTGGRRRNRSGHQLTRSVPALAGAPDAYSPLRAVRLAGHDGFDRVVFEFDGEVPGYLVAYGPTTVAATDDTPVTVAGGAGLAVTLFGGGQWLLDHAALPRQVVGDTAAVTEARQIDDFEAVNRWLVGVDRQRPFEVSTLQGPSRLVIDVVRDR